MDNLIEKHKGKVQYFINEKDEVVKKCCTSCYEIKPIDEFYNRKKGIGGKTPRCKICAYGLNQQYLQNSVNKPNPKKVQRPGTMKYSEYKKKLLNK
ncbi:hypothetical protein B1B04_24445 [Lysinibacillus sp. KCTC 33748]|uniref:hypothetical protein n=1 Tax=unclassified Lysinibacillus TaxID=2636778 RepID=UPI0009A7E6D2|nr:MULTISPECIES: hypothetical protein [unclassified Lysinibacillus]OXS66098.1 hypothetical protein B1B04_24445 [Lysinibacillus sp. KCTC 33748]SKC18457.1 hypothetical protein SAMN06295926_13730 [Lysinibacillus sp. AC-3]